MGITIGYFIYFVTYFEARAAMRGGDSSFWLAFTERSFQPLNVSSKKNLKCLLSKRMASPLLSFSAVMATHQRQSRMRIPSQDVARAKVNSDKARFDIVVCVGAGRHQSAVEIFWVKPEVDAGGVD